MPLLRFQARWIDPILSGAKTQTLRRSLSGSVLCAEVVDAACRYDRPAFARLRVTAIDRVGVAELTEIDAVREGLSLEELRETVESLYPGVRALLRVRFALA
jgi:uncharacterized protein YqfB (UPF0267 family)